MNRQLLLWIIIGLNSTGLVQAQWTEKDSIWLRNVLSGKEKLQLNSETMRAIESGTLLTPDPPATHMRMAPSSIPLSKDFSEYIQPDGLRTEDTVSRRRVALKYLPPAVFMRYGLDQPMRRSYFTPSIKASALPADIKENAVSPSGISFDDMLRSLFSPAARARRQNAKRWQTNKYYNNYP